MRLDRIARNLGFLAAFSAMAACGGDDRKPSPNVVVTVGAVAGVTTGSATPFNFGNVAILSTRQQIFTLTNTGDAEASIQGVTTLGLSAPYAALAAAAQNGVEPCAEGMILPPDAACLVGVSFVPTAEGSFNANLQVSYVQTSKTESKSARLQILGSAYLDCAADAALAASRLEGVDAARAQMNLDAARGKADGEALTPAQGRDEGYSKGYNSGYNAGYHSADGFSRGERDGYNEGLNAGLSDPRSCSDGTNRGASDGDDDGYNDGGNDGYNDGYDDGLALGGGNGYNDGYNAGRYSGASEGSYSGASDGASQGRADGYDAGYYAGESLGYSDGYDDGLGACYIDYGYATDKSRRAGDSAAPNAANYVTACYNQGYNATYSSSAYTNAFEQAKADNRPYQDAYRQGLSDGTAQGTSDGTARGYADGRDRGYLDGFEVGADERYQQCYNSSYPRYYNAAYTEGYNASYASGIIDGSADAYALAYANGEADGSYDGYNATYAPAYNAEYGPAYDYGYDDGYADGYDASYISGYADGEFASCGDSYYAATSSAARAKRALSKRVIVTPAHDTPSGPSLANKVQPKAKTAVAPRKLAQRAYGRGQAWWTQSNGVGVSTFVPAVLPKAFAASLKPSELKAFTATRDLGVEGSLRSFLRGLNRERRFENALVPRAK